ncbi:hypothetical protein NQ318_019652 [Aromia moschata]|uniref:Uncharacterized protein n=1 Tax=Aromia moschata TaxID=1265417 RepID=A0AAV8Z591_9CUCU|nr:hypothetical protein NQ318_019652 [Aromia moschata]
MDVYYPGFPTMKHLKYKAYLKAAKIRVFESPSRNENMIVQIIPDEKFSGEMIPVDLLGTSVFVGWPHLVEAKVVAISNSKRKYVNIGQAGEYNYEDRTGPLVSQFEQEINSITEFYKRRWGIEVGDTNVLVHAQVMIGRRYVFSPNGRVTLEKQFAQQTSNYPLQAVVFNIAAYDSLHSTFRDLENVFPKGCSCFTLTNPYYGSRGVVEDCQISKNGRIKISVYVQEEPDFTTVKELHARIIRNYKTLHHAASALSVAKFLFSRLTGSIFVNVRNNEGGFKSVSIGLDLKFNKRNKETPGYTKKIANTWYYTDRAVELVKCYGERFPEVLNYLSHENADEINAEDIFKENCDEKMKELLTWLKSLPVHAVERQTCYSEVIEPEIVEELERIIDKCPTDVNVKKVTMQIKPSFLYRPEVQSGTLMPDPKTETKVLDRIVNVRSDFTVPLGLKGTVISVHKSTTGSDRDVMYDVVFDKQFSGGMRLNCSENRGYRLPTTAFINISYGQRLLEQRTGNPRAEACQPNAYGQNNYRTPNFSCNNFVPQQVQQQPQPQQHMPFQKENSAFAQFSAGFRQPYASPQYNNGGHPQNFYAPSAGNKPARQAQNYVPQQSNQNVSNGRSIAQGPAVYQKSDNNFMPTFGNKEREVGKSVQHSPERPSINTEYLKSMLKIGGGRPNTHNGSSKGTVSAASTSKKDDRPDSIQFDIFAQAANAPASVRLLTYYQSNGLGLPRYLYFNQRNSTQSQIILPTGEQVTGRPARTREEASENKRDTSSTTKSPDSFPPVPPETWVQPAEINDRSRNDDRRDDKQTKTAGKSRTDTAVLNNSFVPLQAIKSHISKVNNTSNRQPADDNALRESIEIAKSSKLSKNISRDSQKGQDMSTQDDRMPRRERKTRIAANFIAVKK